MTVEQPEPSPSGQASSTRKYAKGLGSLLIAIGLLLCIAWGFRVWILLLLNAGDPWLVTHSLVAAVSLGAAVLLLRIGLRTIHRLPTRHDPLWITLIGLWIAGVGVHRLVAVTTQPMTDPNPRAHLHLSVLFMVIGAVLLGVAWFWKPTAVDSSLQEKPRT